MKSANLALIMLISALLLAAPSQAAYTANINAAKEFIATGQYDAAIPLLEETVLESPDIAEGYFLLGVAGLWSRSCSDACVHFKKALELDPGLVVRMSVQIKDRVMDRILAGDMEEAKAALAVAVKYDPELRREITQSCLYRGEGYLDSGDKAVAEDLFQFVAEMDPQLKTNICELLYSKARAATGEESLRLVVASLRYGDRYQRETVKMIFRLANDLDDETARQGYLEMTAGYVEPENILQSSVEYYTRLYGQPSKISLFTPSLWIGADKSRKDSRIRYLTGDKVLTRGDTGPRELEISIYTAKDFPGIATVSDKGYFQKIWFSAGPDPGTVYYWTVQGP
jgi:tetratricopeptide (TPR) repeat protein